MTQEALKLALEALEMYGNRHRATYLLDGAWDEEITLGDKAITAIKEALAKEKTLQALHSENERLGLYKDAYAEQEPEAWMYQEYRDDDQFGWRDEIQFVQPPNDPNYFRNIVPVYTTPPQLEERNFCSRCGKRLGGINSIHTCTPPMEKNT
jgi:hypothetical protein